MRQFATFAATSALLGAVFGLPLDNLERRADENSTAPGMILDFADVPITKDLDWIPCFEKFTCTNLEVPLDYEDQSAGSTVIAFVKFEGGDGTGPNVVVNPGGPGGSGVEYVLGGSQRLLEALGENHNLVGFDPRGVNRSGPALTCFPDHPEVREKFDLQYSVSDSWNERFQRAKAYGQLCSENNKDTKAKYAGTSAVVQDIKHFIELQAVADGKEASEAMLWYYGVSYGTVIGQTFAAMYPEKVERMVLDANVYGEGHYQGESITAVDDSDAAIGSFFTYCAEAGPDKCPFAGNNTDGELALTSDELETRYRNLLDKIDAEPPIVPGQQLPTVLDRLYVESRVFSAAYSPMVSFPILAHELAALEAGNITTAYEIASAQASAFDAELEHPIAKWDSQESLIMITCIDVGTRGDLKKPEDYAEYARKLEAESSFAGAQYAAANGLLCSGTSIYPPESQFFPGFKETKTANPILFIGTTRDPITPLSSADQMSKLFPGSTVLTQDTTGHGFKAVKSACTYKHVQTYFAKGTLPESNTLCQGDVTPIVDPPSR